MLKKKIKEEIRIQGLPICSGIAIGRAVLFSFSEDEVPEFSIDAEAIDGEIERYRRALQRSKSEVQKLKSRLEQESAWDGVAILDTHLHMLQDPSLTVDIEEQIRVVRKNTESIVKATVCEYQQRFNKISDSFFQERFQDIQDISRRIIRHLQEVGKCSLADLPNNSIVFAEELTPSDTAEARGAKVGAFVTERGGPTSHVAIMAKAQGIPYVANVVVKQIQKSTLTAVIVDGFSGEVIFNPNKETLEFYRNLQKDWKDKNSRQIAKISHLPAETIDGYKVMLTANIELLPELDLLHQHGGEGIGLFRSESLLMTQGRFPSEEEQFLIYKRFVENMRGLPIVLRTFDIGGDKFGRFYVEKREDNPFLGCRAIRLMLKEKEIFKTQLRAILRAAYFGDVSILFPMVSCSSEFFEAKDLLETVKKQLELEGIPHNSNIRLGCMIEVPSAALIADFLAKECDFLSIGTNDLVQYAIAVDRGNQAMSYLYSPAHPSVLRMMKMVITEATRHGTPITVCGEMAGDPSYTGLLLGLGVQELSVIPNGLPLIKNEIRSLKILECVKLADTALTLYSPKEVYELIKNSQVSLS